MAQQETTVVSKPPHACGDSVVPDEQQDIWKIMLDEILSMGGFAIKKSNEA